MSRKYVCPLEPAGTPGTPLSVPNGTEIISLTAGGMGLFITRLVLKIVTPASPTSQFNQFLGRVTASLTPGSGGVSGATNKVLPGDAASSATSVVGNTTPGTGTFTEVYSDSCYILQGIDTPAPGDGIFVAAGGSFTLVYSGSQTLTMVGYLEIEERF